MGQISVSLPSDGETANVSDYNTPITTIVDEFNGSIDNSNISASAAIAGSKLASGGVGTTQIADDAVTPAKWTNPYCFRAYQNSVGTSLVDATATKILFDTEQYDYNNNFAGSTYTAPVAGVYNFSGAFRMPGISSGSGPAFAILYKNGTNAIFGAGYVVANDYRYFVSGDILLAANDTVELYGYQNSAGDETTNPGTTETWFCGHLVAAI